MSADESENSLLNNTSAAFHTLSIKPSVSAESHIDHIHLIINTHTFNSSVFSLFSG